MVVAIFGVRPTPLPTGGQEQGQEGSWRRDPFPVATETSGSTVSPALSLMGRGEFLPGSRRMLVLLFRVEV